jgi:hypothetical protein
MHKEMRKELNKYFIPDLNDIISEYANPWKDKNDDVIKHLKIIFKGNYANETYRINYQDWLNMNYYIKRYKYNCFYDPDLEGISFNYECERVRRTRNNYIKKITKRPYYNNNSVNPVTIKS